VLFTRRLITRLITFSTALLLIASSGLRAAGACKRRRFRPCVQKEFNQVV
jgi:hypothetical protein